MGRVLIAGGNPSMAVPVPGIAAGDLAVGSIVKLMENGTAVEYLVVNQGKPSSSSLYDDSCNGTWLLRKDIYENRAWHSSSANQYASSSIHTYLNGTFLNLFDADIKAQIKQVKIPYGLGGGTSTVYSGANGLSAKVFLLGAYEVGWTTNSSIFPVDGACLSYFSGTSSTDSKRIAYLNGTATNWWTRSPKSSDTSLAWYVNTNNGGFNNMSVIGSNGIRPALVLPSTATFDQSTLVLKGGA